MGERKERKRKIQSRLLFCHDEGSTKRSSQERTKRVSRGLNEKRGKRKKEEGLGGPETRTEKIKGQEGRKKRNHGNPESQVGKSTRFQTLESCQAKRLLFWGWGNPL